MSKKEPKQSGNKAGSKRQRAKAAAKPHEPLGGVLQLQHIIGNQAVSQLLSGVGPRRPLQAEFTVGSASDAYEREADRVAAEVVCAPTLPAPLAQRAGAADELQAKPLASTITPLAQREVQEELPTKPGLPRSGGGFEAGAEFEERLEAARVGGKPLPGDTRDFMEQRIGADFSGVKVHTDGQADRLNQAIQAKAFTTGQDVFFRQGDYQPESQGGQELIAHELTHVVQQTGVGPRKQHHPEPTKPPSGGSPSQGVFWGSTRSASHSPNSVNSGKSLWGASPKINPANLFAKRATKVEAHSSSNTSPDIQRYETSAGFFGNKVKFESSGFTGTLAKALNIQQNGTGVSISSQDYDAAGTVKASGPKERVKEFEVGFLQTVYDSRRSFFYEPDPYDPGLLQQIGTAIMPSVFGDRLKMTDLCDPLPVRDGDTGVVPWYGTETVKSFDEAPESSKTASMYDKPGTATMNWTETINGTAQNLVKTRGQDVFRSWLSVQEKGTTGFFGMHRLGYIDWKVDYGTDITFNKANPAASVVTPTGDSGGKIIGINEGPGIKLPLMDDPTANDAAKDERSNW